MQFEYGITGHNLAAGLSHDPHLQRTIHPGKRLRCGLDSGDDRRLLADDLRLRFAGNIEGRDILAMTPRGTRRSLRISRCSRAMRWSRSIASLTSS